MILVEAPGKNPRPCIDYRLLKASVRTQYFPLSNIEDRVERVSAAKYITVIDLAKGVNKLCKVDSFSLISKKSFQGGSCDVPPLSKDAGRPPQPKSSRKRHLRSVSG
ncbi:hypothetical protein AVEN_158461-1 [Araneus ventricosus]|uniref:Uncharacterized protein n=1 Tax=Araneus ventricosus TaxID=182803 RepID=A0A4Y2UI79_ARAVE|nr:hypothetical protein AVEN_158461-1 [Araneus ventricosus]